MLRTCGQLRLSEYDGLYDLIVDKNHLLRKIKENIDFSFVNPMLRESYCERFGRPAKEPEMMFKPEFLKKIYDLSDEALIRDVKVNMTFKYFLGMNPEDEPVDSSLLTKFRRTRITKDILEGMLSETVRQAMEKKLIKSRMIIVDATHSRTGAREETPTQILRRLTKELRKEIYRTQFELSGKFPEKPLETADLSEEIEYSKKLVGAVRPEVARAGSDKSKKTLSRITALLESDRLAEIQSLADRDARAGHKCHAWGVSHEKPKPLKNPRFFVLKAGGYKFIHKMTHGRFLMTGNIKLARGKWGAAGFTPSWAPPALRFSLR